MQCTYCESEQVFTVNSRTTGKSQVWRRRKCENCKRTFSTKEKLDLSGLVVLKKDGTKIRYARARMFAGIYNSARDTKGIERSEAAILAEELTEKIEQKIAKLYQKDVKSRQLARIVLETLLDEKPNIFMSYLAYFTTMKDMRAQKKTTMLHWQKMIKQATE